MPKFFSSRRTLLSDNDLRQAIEQGDLTTLKKYFDDGGDPNTSIITNDRADVGIPATRKKIFHLAAQTGNPEVIKVFLRKKSLSINAFNEEGKTAICCAAEKDHGNIIMLLSLHGADVNLSVPLVRAAGSGNYSAVQTLLNRGADPKLESADLYSAMEAALLCPDFTASPSHNDVVIALAQHLKDYRSFNSAGQNILQVAISKGCSPQVVEALSKFVDINHQDAHGMSAAHLAVAYNNPAVLSTLVSRGIDLRLPDSEGDTAAHIAIKNLDDFEYILRLCRDVTPVNKAQQSLLHIAAARGNAKLVNYLVRERQLNIDALDKSGLTPFYSAIHNNNTETARALMDLGTDFNAVKLETKTSPLQRAIFWKGVTSQTLKFLIEECGMDINEGDENGKTPLMRTIVLKNTQAFSNLLRLRANLNVQDIYGNSALHIALFCNDVASFRILLTTQGIDPNVKNWQGLSVLELAVLKDIDIGLIRLLIERFNLDINEETSTQPLLLLSRNVELFDYLLERGADPHRVSTKGVTALYMAITLKSAKVAKLLAAGLDPSARNIHNENCSFPAVWEDNSELLSLLEEHQVDMHIKSRFGQTLLHVAVSKPCKMSMIRHLVNDHHLSPNEPDMRGITPLIMATKHFQRYDRIYDRGREILDFFHSSGVGSRSAFVSLDSRGRLPLHNAAESSDIETVKAILARTLIMNDCCLEATDDNGDTPLTLAIKSHNQIQIINLFLFQISLARTRDYNPETLLLAAIESDNEAALKEISKAIKVYDDKGFDLEKFRQEYFAKDLGKCRQAISKISARAEEPKFDALRELSGNILEAMDGFKWSLQCKVSMSYMRKPEMAVWRASNGKFAMRSYDKNLLDALEHNKDPYSQQPLIGIGYYDSATAEALDHFIESEAQLQALTIYSYAKSGKKEEALAALDQAHSTFDSEIKAQLTKKLTANLLALEEQNPDLETLLRQQAQVAMMIPSFMYSDGHINDGAVCKAFIFNEENLYKQFIAKGINYTLKDIIESYRSLCAVTSLDIAKNLVAVGDKELALELLQHANWMLEPIAEEKTDLAKGIREAIFQLEIANEASAPAATAIATNAPSAVATSASATAALKKSLMR